MKNLIHGLVLRASETLYQIVRRACIADGGRGSVGRIDVPRELRARRAAGGDTRAGEREACRETLFIMVCGVGRIKNDSVTSIATEFSRLARKKRE